LLATFLPQKNYTIKLTQGIHMKKNMPYIILLLSIIYVSVHIFYFELIKTDEIEIPSILSEGLIALITLFSIFLLKINNNKIYSLMLLGLGLIYAAMVTDTLDEIYSQPSLLSLIMEDLTLIVGFIFINLGIYSWSSYSSTLRVELEKRVNDEIEKNKNKEIIIFNQSKLSAMGEMITSIAHQWRQPLNALAASVQMVGLDYDDELVDKKYLEEFEHDNMHIINYMSKTIDDFRDFAKENKNKEIVNIKDFIQDSFSLFKTQLDDKHIEFELTGDECKIDIIKNEFRQVVLNLVNNAKDELIQRDGNNPKIEIKIVEEEDICSIKVIDNAGGIPQDILNRVFEPYFTTKEQGKGTGLGLYMSKRIIEESMNGKITAENTEKGAVFSINMSRCKR